jgi:hypothetical protein
MAKLIFKILAVLPFIQSISTQNNIPFKIKENTVVCEALFSKDGKEKTLAAGLIIADQYVVTCYHFYTAFGKYPKPLYIVVRYNFRSNDEYDSVEATGEFSVLPTQYDFSKHHYEPKDYSTDIIVLKLAKKIIAPPIELPNFVTKQGDTLYSLGLTRHIVDGTTFINREFAPLEYVFTYYFAPKRNPIYIAVLGDVKEGFSGAGLFNAKGQVLGMIQFGWDNWSKEIDDIRSSGGISENIYNSITSGYARGQRIGFAINMGWLIDNYLIGYMHLPPPAIPKYP